MKFETSVKISKAEVKRLNDLLSLENLEEMTDQELLNAGANTNDYIPVFCADFDDGSYIYLDVCSGSENYYDDVVFCAADGNYINFDPEYEIDDIEFEENNNTYKVIIERI